MRRIVFCLINVFLFCIISCNVGMSNGSVVGDGDNSLGLSAKDAVIKYSTYEYGTEQYPVVAYVTASGHVRIAWMEPWGEGSEKYAGLEISWSVSNKNNNDLTWDPQVELVPKGNKPFKLDKAEEGGVKCGLNGHYGSNGDKFVNTKAPEKTEAQKREKYKWRDAAWEDAKLRAIDDTETSSAYKMEQDMPIGEAKKLEHLVINVRASEYKKYHDGKAWYYPYTTLSNVVEFVTACDVFGHGYNVAKSPYFSHDSIQNATIIDLLKLKNKNKYTIGEVKTRETSQFYITGDTKEDFIKKYNEKVGNKNDFHMGTEFYGHKFNFDFENQFKYETTELKTSTQKNYFSRYRGKVSWKRQYLLDQYASYDYLKDCLTDYFKRDINDSGMTPEDLFDKYGTHVLLDVELGGRVDLWITGTYDTKSTTTTTEEVVKEKYIVYASEKSESTTHTTTFTTDECEGGGSWIGGAKGLSVPRWTGTRFVGDVDTWSKSINDDNAKMIDSPTCLDNENSSTGIWNYADDPKRRQEIKNAYLEMCYENYASLLGGMVRTADDGLYIKSFGFVTFNDPDYPNSNIAADKGMATADGYVVQVSGNDARQVKKTNMYMELTDINEKNARFPDYPADDIYAKAIAAEKAKGNVVEKEDIHFFEYEAGGLFKIVDGRRNIYSDPTLEKDSIGQSSNVSVHLGGNLRYKNTRQYQKDIPSRLEYDRPFVGRDENPATGYTFFYPYYVTTHDPYEAITGIISDGVSLSSGALASGYTNAAAKNSMFSDYGITGVCYDNSGNASNFDDSKRQAFADSWRSVSDYVFNVYRPGDARETLETGHGDLLEDPINLGDFKYYWQYADKGKHYGESEPNNIGSPSRKTYLLKDTAYVTNSVYTNRDPNNASAVFKMNGSNMDGGSWPVTTEPMVSFHIGHWKKWWGWTWNSIYVGQCTSSQFTIDYTKYLNYFTDGKLFNAYYPKNWPSSGASRIAPALVYTSNRMDEKGNTRELDVVKPIKDIDFIFCRTNNVTANDGIVFTSHSKVEDGWELVKDPVGASEWFFSDNFSTKKNLRIFDPVPGYVNYMHRNNALIDGSKGCMYTHFLNKNKKQWEGYGDFFPPECNDKRYRMRNDFGVSLFSDLLYSRRNISKGNYLNYFVRVAGDVSYKDEARFEWTDYSPTTEEDKYCTVRELWRRTEEVNDTLHDAVDYPYSETVRDDILKGCTSDSYDLPIEIRDMDRYDIYIRFRR